MDDVKILKGQTGRIFQTVMEAIIPRGGPFEKGAADLNLIPRVDRLLQASHPALAWAFPLMLQYLQYTSLWTTGKVFTRLSPQQRSEFLGECEHNFWYNLRAMVQVLKLMTTLAFYDDDDAAAAIGYSLHCDDEEEKAACEEVGRPEECPGREPLPVGGIREFADYPGDISETYDVCVIGSGAGGAAVAYELARRGLSVAVLEEGGHHTVDTWDGRALSALTEMYRDGGTTGTLGRPFIPLSLGKCIGGTTTINSATCFRTPEKILAKWRNDLGLAELTREKLDPYFERVEQIIGVTQLSWDVLGNPAKIVRRGCDKLGLSCRPLSHNVRGCKGCGTCQFGCPEMAKQSTDVTYIPMAVREGARVLAHCRAQKVRIQGGTATGVVADLVDPVTGKKKYKARIDARIVVCACGSLMTPGFLRNSGLSSKHLGRHLQIHPAGRVVAQMDEKVEGWKGVSQGGFVDDFENEGIMLEGIFVPPGVLLAGLPGMGHEHKEMAANYPWLAAFGVMIHDSSEGRVYRERTSGRFVASYQPKKVDVEKFKRGIAYTARIFFAAGAKRVYTSASKMPVLNRPEDVDTFLKLNLKPHHIEMMAFHPLGTARMATDPELGPVNPDGETFEVKNLFVADGSIVPSSLGVNPQVTIMTLASVIAEKIAARLGKEGTDGSNKAPVDTSASAA